MGHSHNLCRSNCVQARIILAAAAVLLSAAGVYSQLLSRGPTWTRPFSPCWILNKESYISRGIASDNDHEIFFLFDSQSIRSLNTAGPTLVWRTDLGVDNLMTRIVTDQKNLYLVSNPGGDSSRTEDQAARGPVLRAISKATGVTIWQNELSTNEIFALDLFKNSLRLISTQGIERFDPSTGEKFTRTDLPIERFYSIDMDLLLFRSPGDSVSGASVETGEALFSVTPKQIPATAVKGDHRTLIFGDDKGRLSGFDLQKKSIKWQASVGGAITYLTPADDGIVVSSRDNFLYSYKVSDGSLNWKKRLPGRTSAPPVISGTNILVVMLNDSNAFVIDLRNGKLANRIRLPENVEFTGSAAIVSDRVLFPTSQGVRAYGPSGCK